jgi:hypothetical protein
MDGVVLAVHGEQFPARLPCGGHDQFARSNENFFVGEGDGAAEFDGFVGGFEAHYTYSGRDNDIGVGMRPDGKHALATVMNRWKREVLCTDAAREVVGERSAADGNHFGTVACNLRKKFIQIGTSGERTD